MMKTSSLKSGLFFLFMVVCMDAQAQVFDDWEARPSISIGAEPGSKWELEATYYLYFDQDISKYSRSELAAEAEYALNNWLAAGFEYRYGMARAVNYHEFRYSLIFTHQFEGKRWELEYKPTFEHAVAHGFSPEYFWRNKLELSYVLNKMITLFIFTENYQLIEGGLQFAEEKSALGAEFELGGGSEIEFRFTVKNKPGHINEARIAVDYGYTFGN